MLFLCIAAKDSAVLPVHVPESRLVCKCGCLCSFIQHVYLYVCMYLCARHRAPSTRPESHLHSAPLPVANGIHAVW